MGEKNVVNIHKVLALSDDIDYKEGKEAYSNYNKLLRRVSEFYKVGFTPTVAAFASLSPSNDYMGTLRSVVTLIQAVKKNIPIDKISTSTYRHCLVRAYEYFTGQKDFLLETEGLKIKNFYCNILHPEDKQYITIDGHAHSIWLGKHMTMKEALFSRSKYFIIAEDYKKAAKQVGLLPNQVQAITWFTWKRINLIRYDSQVSIFNEGCDYWGLDLDPKDIIPFKQI